MKIEHFKDFIGKKVLSLSLIPLRARYNTLKFPFFKISPNIDKELDKKIRQHIGTIMLNSFILELNTQRIKGVLKGKTSKERFNNFTQFFFKSSNIKKFFLKYPRIKAKLKILINNLCQAHIELLQRINSDIEIIQSLLKKNNLTLVKITNSGDFHNGGRSTSILTFVSKEGNSYKCLYKPKNLGIDVIFQGLLSWINGHTKFNFYNLQIVSCNKYGWSEFVENKECHEEQLSQYYYNFGGLLGLTYILGGSDLHYENIIAYKHYPVVVDYECFFQPIFNDSKFYRPHVYNSMILPVIMFENKKFYVECSALFGDLEDRAPISTIEWVNVGKDTMKGVKKNKSFLKTNTHLPKIHGNKINILRYEKNFIAGFRDLYKFILNNKTEFLIKLQDFKDSTVRLVLRGTAEYAQILMETLNPLLLHDAKELEKFINNNLLNKKQLNNTFEVIVEYEKKDLYLENIPYFCCKADKLNVFNGYGEKIPVKLITSCLENTKKIVMEVICEQDLKFQLKLIANSYDCMRQNYNISIMPYYPKYHQLHEELPLQSGPPNIKELIINYLEEFNSLMIDENDYICWPTTDPVADGKYLPNFTGLCMYNGIIGIALMYAYSSIILNKDSYMIIARKCIETYSKSINNILESKDQLDLGAYAHIGGGIFVLCKIYNLIKEEEIASLIRKLIYSTDQILERYRDLDIVSGLAGYLSALLCADNILEDEEYKILITKIVTLILEKCPKPSLYLDYFKNSVHEDYDFALHSLTLGYAHGIAGISVALAKAINISNKTDTITTWIEQALEYEKLILETEFNFTNINKSTIGWNIKKDSATRDNPLLNNVWCNGNIGIGISRLELFQVLKKDYLIRDVLNIVNNITDSIHNIETEMPRNLCHGIMGISELLTLSHQHKIIDPDKYDSCIQVILQELISRKDKDRYRSNTGLMLGSSGVIYQLCRLLSPDKVPSVLSFK